MRSFVIVLLFGLAGCQAIPVYENPPKQQKVERLWKARDLCLLANTPQFDDHVSDPRKVARFVANSCSNETNQLMEMAIPEPNEKARLAFQQEAERRAAAIVVDFRRVDAVTERHKQIGAPTPLQ
jgi:hypothetical protein